MIIIKEDLLDLNTCNILINYFENNIDRTHEHRDTRFLNIHEVDFMYAKKLNYFYSNFLNSKGLSVFPECTQVVKWPLGSYQDPHIDTARDYTVYTSITYLNDNFEGGNTYLNNDFSVKPKTGKGFFFDGLKYEHGVSKVNNGTRYTLAIWYTNNLDNII